MAMSDIPATYDEWLHCITVKCKIELTPQFAKTRIAALEDTKSPEAVRFAKCYGKAHLARVIEWYRRAAG